MLVSRNVINIVLYEKTELFNFAARRASRTRKILSWLNNNFRNLYRSKNLFNPIYTEVRICLILFSLEVLRNAINIELYCKKTELCQFCCEKCNDHKKSCHDWTTILQIFIQVEVRTCLILFSLRARVDLNLFLRKQHSSYCGHTLWFFLKYHLSMTQICVLPEFDFFSKLKKESTTIWSNKRTIICTEII